MNEQSLRGNDTFAQLSGPIGFARSKSGAIAVFTIVNMAVAYVFFSGSSLSESHYWLEYMIPPASVLMSYQLFLCFGVLANFRSMMDDLGATGQVLRIVTYGLVVLLGLAVLPAFYSWFAGDFFVLIPVLLLAAVLLVLTMSVPALLVIGYSDLWAARARLNVLHVLSIVIGAVGTAFLLFVLFEQSNEYSGEIGRFQMFAVQCLGAVYILITCVGFPAFVHTLFSIRISQRARQSSPIATVMLLSIFVLGAGGTLFGWQSIKHERVYMKTQVVDDVVYLPPPTALRMASMGYGAAWGDLLFVRTHAYYLRHMYGDQIFRWLETYADAVITLDPDNHEIYYWASQVVRYGQSVSEEIIERSNQFAEQGLKRFPDDARLYVHLGFNQYFELRPLFVEKEQKLRDRLKTTETSQERSELLEQLNVVRAKRSDLEEQALVNYTTAAMLPHSAIDPIFLFDLYIKQDQTEAAVHIAKSLYFDVGPQNRKQLLERLRIAGRDEDATVLETAQERYDKAMPYVSPELYRMVGSMDDLTVPRNWDRLGEFFEALDAVRDESRPNEEVL